MIEKIGILYRKTIFNLLCKDPCLKCIVQASCHEKCDKKWDWVEKKSKVRAFFSTVSDWVVFFLLLVSFLLLAATFVLGLWKWWDLIKAGIAIYINK
jgi:hypothetical protein